MSDCSLHLDYLRVPGRVYQELASLTMTQSLYIAKGKPGPTAIQLQHLPLQGEELNCMESSVAGSGQSRYHRSWHRSCSFALVIA